MWNFLTKTKVGRWLLLSVLAAIAILSGILIVTNGKFPLQGMPLYTLLVGYGGVLLFNILVVMDREQLGTWRPLTNGQLLFKKRKRLQATNIHIDLVDLQRILEAIAFIVQETKIDFEQKGKELLNKKDSVTYQEVYDYYRDNKLPEDEFYHLVRLKCFYANALSNPNIVERLKELKECEVQLMKEIALMEKIFEQIQREDSVD